MGGMPALSSASASPSEKEPGPARVQVAAPWTAWHRGPWRPRSPPEPQGTLGHVADLPSSGSQQMAASIPFARPVDTKCRAPAIIPSSSTRAASTMRPGNGPSSATARGEQGGHEPGLHVGAAPAVEAAVADVGTERIGGPGARVALGHDVGVPLEEERRSGLSALHHGVDVGPAGSDGVELRRPTEVAELVGHEAAAPSSLRRWVVHARDAHQRLHDLDERRVVHAHDTAASGSTSAPRGSPFRWDQVLEPHQRDIGGLDEPVRRLPVSLEEVLDGADAVGAAVGTRDPMNAPPPATITAPLGSAPLLYRCRWPDATTLIGRPAISSSSRRRRGIGTDQSPRSATSGSTRQIGWCRKSTVGRSVARADASQRSWSSSRSR